MATQNILKPLDVNIDKSPVCKRARYDLDSSGNSDRWTLSRNDIILDSVYDSGVDRLDSDSELDVEIVKRKKKTKGTETPVSRHEEIAVLQASLPEDTLHKLTLGELDNVLNKPVDRNNYSYDSINYFDLLSDEVILYIFHKLPTSHLSNVALVCRRFSQLAEDESLWTRMDISNKTLERGSIGTVLSRQVIILRLARSWIKSPPILSSSKANHIDFRSRLMYLDLTMATVSTTTLTIIFTKCKRLKKISLESVPINNNVLISLSGSRDLEVVNLAMASGINLEGLKCLLTCCRKIRELNLSWTYLSAESIDFICDSLPPTLERFNFSGCRKLLRDQNVSQLVLKCPHLHELDLSDCTSITGESVKKLTLLEELIFLSLSRCYQISHRALLTLNKLKSLAYLDIHGTYISSDEFKIVNDGLGVNVNINKFKFSSIARPTVGIKKSTIWNMKVRD